MNFRFSSRVAPAMIPAGALLLLAGCSDYHVHYDYDTRFSFAAYKSYDWTRPEKESEGDRYPELLERRVRGAVEQEMSARGFHRVAKGKDPDFLLISFPVYQERHVDTQVHTGPFGTTWHNYYRDGSLVLQMVDFKSNQIVWEAIITGQGRLLERHGDPRETDELVPHAVHALLDKLPQPR